MKDIFKSSLLYDFYGELLTEHQKEIYEDFILNDLSLGEIAQDRGISRQGVHDLVKRCDKILNGYEEKLHLVERFTKPFSFSVLYCASPVSSTRYMAFSIVYLMYLSSGANVKK